MSFDLLALRSNPAAQAHERITYRNFKVFYKKYFMKKKNSGDENQKVDFFTFENL